MTETCLTAVEATASCKMLPVDVVSQLEDLANQVLWLFHSPGCRVHALWTVGLILFDVFGLRFRV